jgi:ribosomal protein S6--L-glutamate ligase
MADADKVIALEARLRGCSNVLTLGVRPNFSDYSDTEATLIRTAEKIYYPTPFYADLFDSVGKRTFPSYHTYKCVQDKIKQTALFELLRIPHPRTRVYYGKRQKSHITKDFNFPFIAKVPRGSALGRGVYLIKNQAALDHYCVQNPTAYIQEYFPIDRDMRIVVIGSQIVHAYWRIAPRDEFRSNVAVGGVINFDPVPKEALALAEKTAHNCKWDDVGIDVCEYDGRYYVLEGNMKYGKEGFRQAGIDYFKLMQGLIEKGSI